VGPNNNLDKPDFFLYSSFLLYKSFEDLGLISSTGLPLKKKYLKFDLKKIGKTLTFILLAIVIKSICQYCLGAQETSLDKVLSAIDYPFYQGCFLGGTLLILFQDN
jgi:hypothetical protein